MNRRTFLAAAALLPVTAKLPKPVEGLDFNGLHRSVARGEIFQHDLVAFSSDGHLYAVGRVAVRRSSAEGEEILRVTLFGEG